FENYPLNPVLTNRNKAPFIIQGIGHGDLVQDQNGGWHIVSLGFRQMHMWMAYHHLGREVFLTPVKFAEDGWFTAGNDGTTDYSYEISGDFEQNVKNHYTFENTDWTVDWCFLRHPYSENYKLTDGRAVLRGTDITLDDVDSPTFVGIRQRDFCFELIVDVDLTGENGEGGVTVYMCESEHYDIAVRKKDGKHEAVLKLNIGGIKHEQTVISLTSRNTKLLVRADNLFYNFYIVDGGKETHLGSGSAKYLSSEVAGGFTGVVIGLYAVGGVEAEFSGFKINYDEE
ncbi:MAG: family 43 glycosylhydrolase, partial [Oscillospiraceae bacterium]|nr:family 43 glycosylhydrolase [Oscillospiraceae bacterium]